MGTALFWDIRPTAMLRTPFHQTFSQPSPTSTSLLPSPHFAEGSTVVPNLKVHLGRSQPATGSTFMEAWGMILPWHFEPVQFGSVTGEENSDTQATLNLLSGRFVVLPYPKPRALCPRLPKLFPSEYFLLVVYPALVGGCTKAMGEHF